MSTILSSNEESMQRMRRTIPANASVAHTQQGGKARTQSPSGAQSRAAHSKKQKDNNFIAKALIALASIVVTLGGWGLFASQDVLSANVGSNSVAIATNTQQSQAISGLRTVEAPQVRQRQSRPVFVTRTRSSH